ncbi:hypothetical protein H072_7511 [Dactylellina haptotyla CBS 200.50]|uniref:Uncharacterized protein n=1 Tax=Dactylellina haptotyla (strain CBS 200.50) TaxID=1284197 RepID=S8A6P7_DACHA|nr:hypothetical protein H072_7511 [Dactylellina haptotyla CBS 200.50]
MTRTTRNSIKAEDMAPQQPPSPAPPPQAPASSLPPETDEDAPITVHKRIRSPLFEKVFEKSLKASLSGVTPESWGKCFPTPMARRPEQMKEVRNKFVEIYELNVRKNFEDIIASRKLLASLDNLDILISEAQTRRTRWLEEHPQAPLPMDPPPKPKPLETETKTETPEAPAAPEAKPEAGVEGEPAATEAAAPAASTDVPEKAIEKEKEDNGPKPPTPLLDFTPEDLYISHLYPLLQIQSDRLEALKLQQQTSIDKLIKRREEQQKEIKQLIATLEKRLSVVDEAAEGVKEILEMDRDEDMIGG